MAKLKSIGHSMPLENGSFQFYESVDRIESSIDFVLSSYSILREYKTYFSTLFLWNMLQTPSNSLLKSAETSFLIRLQGLIQNSVPMVSITSSGFAQPSNDRKIKEFALEYRNKESESEETGIYARFI